MISRLIDFPLFVLYFKVCGIIGIAKIEFFNFPGTERIKSKRKKLLLRKKKALIAQAPKGFKTFTYLQYLFMHYLCIPLAKYPL